MSKLSLTTPRQAVVSVLAGAVLTWGGLKIYDALASFPPVIPWTVPAMLAVVGLCGFIYALLIPKRLEEHKLGPQEGFIAVVTGKAMVITGAVLAGAHTVYIMRYLSSIEAETPLRRVVHGAGMLVASIVLAIVGSMIEHRLRIQEPPDEANGENVESSAA